MKNSVKIKWIESTSTKSGKVFDYIEYEYTDNNEEKLVITKDFEMNDIKRYVLKQLGIVKEVR